MTDVEKIYKESLEWGMKRAEKSNTIALGFHCVVDGLVKVHSLEIKKFKLEDVPEKFEELPTSVKNESDFYKGLLFSFKSGKALQLSVESEEMYSWIMQKFGTGTLRLGGTSANMAKTLSNFPFPKILVYVYPLSKELLSLFPKKKNLFVVQKSGLKHPWKVECKSGIRAVHWIFEFSQGDEIKVNDKRIKCPRSNRFIASWNPVNARLEVKEPFKSYTFEHAKDLSHFLLSGFHIMREVYPNGENARDRIKELAAFIQEMKKRNPKILFHLEFASIRYDGVRKAVEDILFPIVDSLGANEVELSWIARDIGEESGGIENGNVQNIRRVLLKLRKSGLKRIHFHALGFYLLAFDEKWYNVEVQKQALAFAALSAVQRARDGVLKPNLLRDVLKIPVSDYKYKMWKEGETTFVLLPTKVTPHPKITVGLGDVISSMAFVLG